jgi:hypothetical protein
MVMRFAGMAALGHILATIVVVIVFDAARSFAGRRHVAAVVIRRIEATLGLVRLAALFRPALTLEATATAATTPTSTATARAAFTETIAARLAGLDRTILLQCHLLVDRLLAYGL